MNTNTKALMNARRACTLTLLAAVGASTFAMTSVSAYAQALPTNIDSAVHVQPVDIRALHDQLNLNADQEVQWQTALDAMRDSHAAARMNADQLQQRTQTLLQQPILDLSAIHAAHIKAEQQDAQLPEQSAKAWLTFYKGLSDTQKQIFSDTMRPQFENVAHHAAKPYDPRTGL
jgi:periplasmic protein CpxP/Spy